MPVFYQGQAIRVTDRSVELPGGLRIRTPQRGRIRVVTPPGHPRAGLRAHCATGAVALLVLLITGPGNDHTAEWVFVLLIAGMLAELFRRRRASPPRQELWIELQGRWVRLYSSTDPTEFGQVRRAMLRAVEWNEDTRH